MREIAAQTCIQFVPIQRLLSRRSSSSSIRRKGKKMPAHVQIFQGDDHECWSVYGTHDVHPVSLSYGCWDRGTILHELMHVIGFDHSHTRVDRDSFIKIHWNNIDPDDWSEFIVRTESLESRMSKQIPFDYGSIMMYGELNGSKDEESPAISRKDGRRLIDLEDKKRLSANDVRMVNKIYKCPR